MDRRPRLELLQRPPERVQGLTEELWRVPVFLLRFTHDCVQTKFRDGRSVYETLEQLEQGELEPSDLPALDVCVHGGKWWSMSNRRLRVLRMYQSVHMDKVVYATCKLRSTEIRSAQWQEKKFARSFTTLNEGLGVDCSAKSYPRSHKSTFTNM